jgi:hypothetical protein
LTAGEGRAVVPQMLEVAVRDLSKQTSDLAETVRRERPWRRFALVILAVVVLQFGWDGYQQLQRTRTARDTNRIVHVLEDVTAGPAAQKAQQQTAGLIRQLEICDHAYADHAAKGSPIPEGCP